MSTNECLDACSVESEFWKFQAKELLDELHKQKENWVMVHEVAFGAVQRGDEETQAALRTMESIANYHRIALDRAIRARMQRFEEGIF